MADTVTTGTPSAAPSSSASTPSSSTPASSTPASATATPSAEPSSTAVATPAGEPPKERWADILDNTRTKTRAEVEAEYRSKYGWADQFTRDPYSFVDAWMDQLSTHPQYSALLAAKAARLLNGRRGQQAPVVEKPKPDVPIVDANGQQVGWAYSADAQDKLDAWRDSQRAAQFDERLKPLEEVRHVIEQAQAQARVDADAGRTLSDLRQDPYFAKHEPKFKAFFAQHEEFGDDVKGAWLSYMRAEVYPSLNQTAEQAVREQFKTQAAGATVHPGSTVASSQPKFKDFGEALRYYAEHPQEAEAMAKR